MATVEFRYDPKNTAWFTANAAMILKAGEPAYHDTTGLFKLGDGVTALSALSFLPIVSTATPTIQQVLTAGQVATTTIETTGFIKTGGTSSQFLKADGSVDSSTYLTTLGTAATSLTTNNSSGAATLIANVLNVPNYTLAGLGGTTLAAVNAQNLSVFAATTSSQLAGVISDETGSGALVFGTSPTFTTNITTPLIVGGSAVNSVIQYKGTSGVGTATTEAHQFLVGNNGNLKALSIHNNGNIYVSPGAAGVTGGGLAIQGSFGTAPTGAGFELEYNSGIAFVTAYNRTSAAWLPMTIRGAALTFQSSNNTVISSTTTGTALTFSGATSAATAITNFTFNATANTNQTATSNIPNFRINGANKQWATGTVANQYFNYLTANTVSAVGASTFTNVYGLFVEAATAGTNATITNNWGIGFTGGLFKNSIGNTVLSNAALATNATNGFLYVPSCAGIPTGVPTSYTGTIPIVVDSTNNRMYIYSGGSWVALN